jgi:hypothetical protein
MRLNAASMSSALKVVKSDTACVYGRHNKHNVPEQEWEQVC